MTNKTETAAVETSAEKATVLSPYAAAKLVNTQLTEAGLKNIPPQMMYNYTTARLNAGKAPLIAFTLEGGVDRDALATWTKAYIAKKTAAQVATVAE